VKDLLTISKNDLKKHQVVNWGYIDTSKPKTLSHYENWIKQNLHGPLGYMADHRMDLRKEIKNFFPEFKSALVFLFDYTAAAKKNKVENDYRFASYTQGFDGIDYHYWIKDKLTKLANTLNLKNYKFSIDAEPVLERDLAYKAGLGWFGKNSMLINRKAGSFFLIASILLDETLELDIGKIETDHCGTCTRCIDACPTDAIVDDKIIDANKCISTYTIELFKDAPAPNGYPTQRGEIFGCDICQEVCPWNNKPLLGADPIVTPKFIRDFENSDLENMSNREFKKVFKGTSLERTGRVGMLKNLKR
jgi:epoxyqueuosine reductase